MRICIDIDGVIAEIDRQKNYESREIVHDAVTSIQRLRKEGHYIILYTARHMLTTQSNLGRVLALQGQITLDWLKSSGIEYDEIYFGKPYADVYVDDHGLKFTNWSQVMKEILAK